MRPAFDRILQEQLAALVDVAGRGLARNVDRRVERLSTPEVRGMVAEIARTERASRPIWRCRLTFH